MLLQQLCEYARRHDDFGPLMYVKRPVRYAIPLRQDGSLIKRDPNLLSGSGDDRDRGRPYFVPYIERTSNIRARLLVDNAEYAHGWPAHSTSDARVKKQHQAFIDTVRDCHLETSDADVGAIYRYLTRSDSPQAIRPESLDPKTDNVTFTVDGRFPFKSPSIKQFWAEYAPDMANALDPIQSCLVCGKSRPLVRLFPFKIKNVPGRKKGGRQEWRDRALMSTNEEAFVSYGLKEMSCAPTCLSCAEAACKALNRLLDMGETHLVIDHMAYAFWTRAGNFPLATAFLTNPQSRDVRELYRSIQTGRRATVGIDADHFYCVALTGNVGRVAVQDWIDVSLDESKRHLAQYFKTQELVDPFGNTPRFFGIGSLTSATLRVVKDSEARELNRGRIPGKREDKSDHRSGVSRSLVKNAVRGDPLPRSILTNVLRCIRSDGWLLYPRTVLIKLVLNSIDRSLTNAMVGLNEDNPHPAYHCGRLLAVLDSIQFQALGDVNTTVTDRILTRASTTPSLVLGMALADAQHHLKSLKRDRPGAYHARQQQLELVLARIAEFPGHLDLEGQGLFMLGLYHQQAKDRKDRSDAIASREARESANEKFA